MRAIKLEDYIGIEPKTKDLQSMCKPFTQNPSQKPSVTQAKPFGYEREKNYTGVELEWNLNERQLSGLRHFF